MSSTLSLNPLSMGCHSGFHLMAPLSLRGPTLRQPPLSHILPLLLRSWPCVEKREKLLHQLLGSSWPKTLTIQSQVSAAESPGQLHITPMLPEQGSSSPVSSLGWSPFISPHKVSGLWNELQEDCGLTACAELKFCGDLAHHGLSDWLLQLPVATGTGP